MEINRAYTIQNVKQALSLVDFDPDAAQRKMTPAFRENHRLPGKPGKARLGAVLLLLIRPR